MSNLKAYEINFNVILDWQNVVDEAINEHGLDEIIDYIGKEKILGEFTLDELEEFVENAKK